MIFRVNRFVETSKITKSDLGDDGFSAGHFRSGRQKKHKGSEIEMICSRQLRLG